LFSSQYQHAHAIKGYSIEPYFSNHIEVAINSSLTLEAGLPCRRRMFYEKKIKDAGVRLRMARF
jgi:hypothetical protein